MHADKEFVQSLCGGFDSQTNWQLDDVDDNPGDQTGLRTPACLW